MEDNGQFSKSLIIKFAVPTVIALVSSTISTFVSSIMAGFYYGSVGLAVVGLCSPIMFIFATLGALIGAGSANITAKYISDYDYKEASSLYSIAILLTAVSGAVVTVLFLGFENLVLGVIAGNTGLPMGEYYRIIVISGFINMFIYIPVNFTRIDGNPKAALYMFWAMAICNLLANFFLAGFLKMGIESIAIGNLTGILGANLTGFALLHRKKNLIHVIKVSFSKVRSAATKIFIAGSPMALNNLFTFVKVLFINGLVVGLDGTLLPVLSAIWTLNTFIFAIYSGLGQSVVPLVSILHREKDNTSIRQILRLAFIAGNILLGIIALGLILFSRQVYALFGITEPIPGEMSAMLFFSLSSVIAVTNVLISFHFAGIAKIWIANAITIGRGFLFIIPIAFMLSAFLSSEGIWISFLITELLTVILTIICISFNAKKDRKLTFPLLLERELENSGKYISFSVLTEENAIAKTSSDITEFCESNDMSPKLIMLVSLSIEEMLILVKTHSTGSNSVSARVLLFEGMIILRIRYFGQRFNPIQYYNDNISGDIEKSLDLAGIKYIVSAAAVVDYRETFGANNLIIILEGKK